MSATHGRILIIGGSIAGLFAGVLLSRAGWRVDIYERAGEALASRGAGITTHDELYAAFAQAGIELEHEVAVEARGRVFLDRDGNVLGRYAMPQLMTSWGLLYRLLRERFPDAHYHLGTSVEDVVQDAEGVSAAFADGARERGDYLIGADGMRSTVRERVMAPAAVRYAGYAAWRGLAAEADLPANVRAFVEGRFMLCLPPGEHMLGYLVAGPGDSVAPGERWLNWVWYRPAPEATVLRDLLTGSDGAFYPGGIPHHLIRDEVITAMRADAERLMAPPLRAAIAATPRPFLQPIQELASTQIANGRVMMIGDAAFTARPHVGLGVSKAAEDAATLARVFERRGAAFDAALARWADERLAYGRATVAHSARLGCYLDGVPPADDAERAAHARYREPEIVMAQIAARHPRRYLEL